MSDAQPREEIEKTRSWLDGFVIALGLCPFAAAPFNANRICFRVCDSDRPDVVYQAFLGLLYELLTSDPQENETSILIVSQALSSFDDYLDAVADLEQLVVEAGAEGMVQIASFHPAYRFDGVPADDPANYTNRSPSPMFHLIREEGLAAALESYPDPDAIPQRNIERLRALGIGGIRELLESIGVSGG